MFGRRKKYTDEEIIDGIRKSDNNLLHYVYGEYHNICGRLASDYQIEFDDLMQDTMIAFCENIKLPSFELTAKLSTYFYSICQNQCRKQLRNKRDFADLPVTDIPDEMYQPSKIDEWLERYSDLRMTECFKNLSERKRNVFSAYYYDNMSMAEIAVRFGLTNADAAKVEKNRAINELRKCMGIKNKNND